MHHQRKQVNFSVKVWIWQVAAWLVWLWLPEFWARTRTIDIIYAEVGECSCKSACAVHV